jgi:hypothetical protein
MGYRGKLSEQQQARPLRRAGLPLAGIDRLVAEGRERIGRLSEREFLVEATPRRSGSLDPPRRACAWLRHGQLQLQPNPPAIMGLVGALLSGAAIPG